MKIVLMGDSITAYLTRGIIGSSDDEVKNYGIENIGCGTYRKGCWPKIDRDGDLYILLIGINNLFRPDCDYDEEESLEDVPKKLKRLILDIKRDKPDVNLWVQSIYPTEYEDTKNRILYVNNELMNICADNGIEYLDMHSLLVGEDGLANPQYFYDGVHLGYGGEEFVSSVINAKIEKLKTGGFSKKKTDKDDK